MPWKEQTIMSQRVEMYARYRQGEPIARLARTYGVSRTTVHKWMNRAKAVEAEGREALIAALADQPRRPHASPRRTSEAIRAQIVKEAEAHPTWGGRKLHHRFQLLGEASIPAPSTITKLLQQEGRLREVPVTPHRWTRFEAAAPNDLWQLDFKGWHRLREGIITPLTMLDDHSRFLLEVRGMPNGQTFTEVHPLLTMCFRRFGLPWAILCDNGPPWGTSDPHAITQFDIWCMQLNIRPIHGRPLHPQTQGKVERLHRTLKADVFGITYPDLATAQRACETFRTIYNQDRPHEALNHQTPASRYYGSARSFPEHIAPPEYAPDTAQRKVSKAGTIGYQGYAVRVGQALAGQPVGITPTAVDGIVRIQYYSHHLKEVDLRTLTKAI